MLFLAETQGSGLGHHLVGVGIVVRDERGGTREDVLLECLFNLLLGWELRLVRVTPLSKALINLECISILPVRPQKLAYCFRGLGVGSHHLIDGRLVVSI